jgi:hypothetical protein
MLMVRRPVAPALVTLCSVGAVIAVVIWAMDPSLLLANTTVAGGDTGAHVALSQYLMTNLLPHGHVTGWDPGAYDGFPLYTLYFPLPDLMAAIAGYAIPFNIAFKLVTILGSVTLPIAAWAFGRLAGLERPRPAVLALATLPFLFDQSFTIYGGNLYSTLAGEYSYSLGLSLGLVFLGTCIRGMRTGRARVPAALLLAACVLCHVITAGFALVGALLVFLLAGPTKQRLWWMVSSIGTGMLLIAWWLVPFITQQAYSTSMGWINVHTYVDMFAPAGNRWALVAAAVGTVFALVRRDRAGLLLTILGALFAIAVVVDPQGKLYNTRFLPVWWMCVYLVAGYALAEVGVLVARLLRFRPWEQALAPTLAPAIMTTISLASFSYDYQREPRSFPREARRRSRHTMPWAPGALSVPLVAMVASLGIVLPDLVISPTSSLNIGPIHVRHSNVSDWAQWNYSGYQRKSGWSELDDGIIATLDRVGGRYGCGRVMWEYNSNLNRFGTPEALMNLPMWTNGCMDSMEGLLFESSPTTPFHFLNQAELSAAPSEAFVPQDGLTYGTLDVQLGVQHLQLLGVRYFMASSSSVQAEADADPSLSLIATTGPWTTSNAGSPVVTTWKIYLVHDAPLVSPLSEVPTVLQGVGAGQSSWLPLAVKWYDNPAQWSRQLVTGGPASWPRSDAASALDAAGSNRSLPPVRVSDVRTSDEQISFHVDRTGVPVLVRTSYYPDWHAVGATGPWRAEPNLMVVVPTSHDVTLSYGSTGSSRAGDVLTLVGLIALVVIFRRRDPLTQS